MSEFVYGRQCPAALQVLIGELVEGDFESSMAQRQLHFLDMIADKAQIQHHELPKKIRYFSWVPQQEPGTSN